MSIIERNPLVSIAVATYNGAEFLAPQLDTLINQTYKNLEIVICDDASTDNTHSIIEAYQKLDSRIKFFPNKENLGFNLNFERTLKHCSGEFIAISDQDDIWLLDKIEIVLNAWEEGVILVHHSTKTFENEPLPELAITNEIKGFSGNRLETLLRGNTVQGCTIMFKREILKLALPFQKDVLYDWWLAICAASEGNIQFMHRNLIYHRRHTLSAHYSKVKEKSKFYYHQEHVTLLNFVKLKFGNRLELVKFIDKYLSILAILLVSRFSFKAWYFFFVNGKIFFNHKRKKFPYFSYVVHSYKNSKGINK